MPFTRQWSGPPFGLRRKRRWPALVLRLAEYGTARYPPKVRRRLKILNVMASLIAIFSAIFAATYALEDFAAYRWAVAINLALVAAAVAAPLLHRYSEIAGAMLIMAAEYAGLFALVALLGRGSGIHLNIVVAAAVAFAVLGLERIRLIVAIVALGFLLHVGAWFLFPRGLATVAVDPAFLARLYVNSALTAFGVTAAIAYYAFNLAERAEAETEALLRNILPEKIVERLKARPGEPVAEGYPEASVLFSDLKSFVPLARSLGPARTVEMLNDLIRRFDQLAAEHGVEKIKTIGDAYMAVAGLPEPAPDHAARLAGMALEMRSAARKTGERFDVELILRIGIAAGPVMAGVIGTRKFSYDVWGDPVNLAARLENSCEANCIHVSSEIRERLAGGFEFRSRGLTDIKGLGRQETFFLVGPREAPQPAREAAA
ncbi:MAG TPA: adenylate/guanylate cyclase domain-containing protein [Beijerinckiaceae bacterium]|jgi:adenylate cyclase|nr:adenylate/guanylate cyclase domain-containing protein [Beijerinckiaceae bacterium]